MKNGGDRANAKRSGALIVIDMLHDFVDEGAPLEVRGARDIIPAIAERIEYARQNGIPVIFLCDRHTINDPEFRVWPAHAVSGTEGAEVVEPVKPVTGDRIISKTTYSGFFDTDLDSVLQELGVEKVTITGVCTSICVLYTAVDAFMRGYDVEVPEDSVAGLSADDHGFALRQLKEVLFPRKERAGDQA